MSRIIEKCIHDREISTIIKKFTILLLLLAPLYFVAVPLLSNGSSRQGLRSPAEAIENHLTSLQEDNMDAEQAARSLNYFGFSTRKGADLAVKLKKIMDGKGLYMRPEDLPVDPNYFDSLSGRYRYYPFKWQKWIYLEKYGAKWQYSTETVGKIEKMYEKTFPVELKLIGDLLPEFAFDKVFGICLWQYAGVVLVALFLYPINKLFNWFFGFLLVRLLRRKQDVAPLASLVKRLAKPISLLMIVLLLRPVVPMFQFDVKLSSVLMTILNAMIPLFLTIIGVRGADMLGKIMEMLSTKPNSKFDDHLVPVLKNSIKIMITGLGGIYLLESLHISITPLLAGVSIGGLALALAAQDTVKNFFGSVMIFTDQPFKVGDWIVFEGKEGSVEQVGIRSTRIRTFYDSVITIPNGKLADLTIDNMGRRNMRRFKMDLRIPFGTGTAAINEFAAKLREMVMSHPDTKKDNFQVNVSNMTDDSVIMLFNVYFAIDNWDAELRARQELIGSILKIADEMNIKFALPQRDIYLHGLTNGKVPKTEEQA